MIDLHLHSGWTDFFHEEQEKRSPKEIRARIETFLAKYEEKGIILSRDAGGFEGPDRRIIRCAGMVSQNNYQDGEFLKKVFSDTGEWVKIMATGGMGAPPENVTDPMIPEREFKYLVEQFHLHGKKVMVHCWGGKSLDWSIEAKADTIEHGVYLTKEQADKMAEQGIPLVPTTAIYRLLAEEPGLFHIPQILQERAKRACEGHSHAIRYALSSGVLIGHGTDFYADPDLVEYAGYEWKMLQDYGLTKEQATAAGTTVAEHILGKKVHSGTV